MHEFTVDLALRWGDMDAMAHLNNVLYFRLIEEARIQMFAQLGFSTLPQGQAPILAHASCDFRRPMTYPGAARVRHAVTRVGRSSVEHAIRIERADEPGIDYAVGRTVIVWYDYDQEKAAPWPDDIRQRLS